MNINLSQLINGINKVMDEKLNIKQVDEGSDIDYAKKLRFIGSRNNGRTANVIVCFEDEVLDDIDSLDIEYLLSNISETIDKENVLEQIELKDKNSTKVFLLILSNMKCKFQRKI